MIRWAIFGLIGLIGFVAVEYLIAKAKLAATVATPMSVNQPVSGSVASTVPAQQQVMNLNTDGTTAGDPATLKATADVINSLSTWELQEEEEEALASRQI